MARSSSTQLTRFISAVTIVTSDVANKWYGGLFGTTEGDGLSETDPLVAGHVHDGAHQDGHAQKVNLVSHVTGELRNVNISDDAVLKRNIQSFIDVGSAIPESEVVNGETYYYLDLSTIRSEIANNGAFIVASNVTSNSPGDLALDDFVYGSDSLDDDADATHDARFSFDKSKGAFRAGLVTGTEWDDANRGNTSVAFGRNNTAAAARSTVAGGDTNVISSAGSYSFIGAGDTNSIAATLSVIGGGQTNTIGATTGSVIAGGTSNMIYISSGGSSIGGGGSNVVNQSVSSIIGGGLSNQIGNGGTIVTSYGAILGGSGNGITGNFTTVGGGTGNEITYSDYAAIVGGEDNTIGTGIAAGAGNYSVISGGYTNSIEDSYNYIGGGNTNSINRVLTEQNRYSVIVGGATNSITAGTTVSRDVTHAFIGGGESNDIHDAKWSNIVGGKNNTIESGTGFALNYAVIRGGLENSVDLYGYAADVGGVAGRGYLTNQFVIGGGWYDSVDGSPSPNGGQIQTSVLVLGSILTLSQTDTMMYLDYPAASQSLTIPTETCVIAKVTWVIRTSDATPRIIGGEYICTMRRNLTSVIVVDSSATTTFTGDTTFGEVFFDPTGVLGGVDLKINATTTGGVGIFPMRATARVEWTQVFLG